MNTFQIRIVNSVIVFTNLEVFLFDLLPDYYFSKLDVSESLHKKQGLLQEARIYAKIETNANSFFQWGRFTQQIFYISFFSAWKITSTTLSMLYRMFCISSTVIYLNKNKHLGQQNLSFMNGTILTTKSELFWTQLASLYLFPLPFGMVFMI